MEPLMVYDNGQLTVWCTECGHAEHFPCTQEQYDALEKRETPIQEIFPELDKGIREMLKSGWCDVCYKMKCSYLSDDLIMEILEYAVDLKLLTEDEMDKIKSAMALGLDPQRFIMDMLTDLECCDGECGTEDLRPQTVQLRAKILEIYVRPAIEEI